MPFPLQLACPLRPAAETTGEETQSLVSSHASLSLCNQIAWFHTHCVCSQHINPLWQSHFRDKTSTCAILHQAENRGRARLFALEQTSLVLHHEPESRRVPGHCSSLAEGCHHAETGRSKWGMGCRLSSPLQQASLMGCS